MWEKAGEKRICGWLTSRLGNPLQEPEMFFKATIERSR